MFKFLISMISLFSYINGAPQQPEINDQYEKINEEILLTPTSTSNSPRLNNTMENKVILEIPNPLSKSVNGSNQTDVVDIDYQPFTTRLYTIFTVPVKKFIATPKVKAVLKNIGICIVNGAMEIISHFFPPPLMPLIASAAGMIIPFEPVVMLREKMPVTSYRRAIKTAVNGFMKTFDRYKVDSSVEDPYMTRRFNRRFMNNDDTKDKVAIDQEGL